MKNGVVIVAGGSGSRMGSPVPKQYLDLCGEPILVRTIRKFFEFDPTIEMVLVLPEGDKQKWEVLKRRFFPEHQMNTCSGGKSRFHSVKNGLALIENAEIIGIHDAVRPLLTMRTLSLCYKSAAEHGAVVPVFPMKSSLRALNGSSSMALDRSSIVAVQTPQCFKKEVLNKAFQLEYREVFTDDASVAEAAGFDIHCVDGNEENIKITSPYDLLIAEVFIKSGL